MSKLLENNLGFVNRPEHKTLTSATVETIREAIKSGGFPQGSQLPSEKDLTLQLGVSRTTLREAYKILENENLIVRKRGIGTFVASVPILKELGSNFGITEMIKEAKLVPGTNHFTIRRERAKKEVSEALQISEGLPVLVIERVRTASGTPVVVSQDYLPTDLVSKKNLENFYSESESLYHYMAENLQLFVTHGEARVWPIVATKDLAEKIAVRKGTPLLVLAQIDYDAKKKPILYSLEYHLGDKFRFVVSRKGPY